MYYSPRQLSFMRVLSDDEHRADVLRVEQTGPRVRPYHCAESSSTKTLDSTEPTATSIRVKSGDVPMSISLALDEGSSHGHDNAPAPANVSRIRSKAQQAVASNLFEVSVLAVIFVNAVILGLQTISTVQSKFGWLLDGIDMVIILLFVGELLTRFFAGGWRFFLTPWGAFDSIVLLASALSGTLSVLRALRSLRLLRMIQFVKPLRRVADGFATAFPGLVAVVPLLVLVLYVWAVMGTALYGSEKKDLFGDLADSFYTLFQVATFENWSKIADELMSVAPVGAWFYLLPFILITSFAALNLFIAVMVDAMQRRLEGEVEYVEDAVEAEQRTDEAMLQQLEVLADEVQVLGKEMAAFHYKTSTIGKQAGVWLLS
jgi:voltage-gated sodium channel